MNITISLLYELLKVHINVKHINRFIRIQMSYFIILSKVARKECVQRIQQLSKGSVIIACDWSRPLDPYNKSRRIYQ